MSLGHGIVEIPLIVLIAVGAAVLLRSETIRAWIGLAGGGFLVFLAAQLAMSLRNGGRGPRDAETKRRPMLSGLALTGANPYFLFWWATVGMKLVAEAADLGAVTLCLFAAVHLLCDVIWLEVLSLASFKGADLLAGRGKRVATVACAAVLAVFGCWFLFDAGDVLIRVAAGG